MTNIQKDRSLSYIMDPMEIMEAHREAKDQRLNVIAVFHSHPNMSSQPSIIDLNHAFPDYSFVIAGVRDRKITTIDSWLLREFRGARRFIAERMKIGGIRD